MESNNSNKKVGDKKVEGDQISIQKNEGNLPAEAKDGGFYSIEQWELAKKEGLSNYKDYQSFVGFSEAGITKEEWLMIKKTGFLNYEEWFEAHNEGFDTKQEWDDWQELKNSGFVDIDLFYETRNIGFMQNSLRKSFLELLKVAKKAGFESYQDWKEAKKWNITTNQDWLLVKEFTLQSKEEYELFKELVDKVGNLLNELLPNQEISLDRIIELIDEEYKFDNRKTVSKKIVYKYFSKEKFEEILQKALRYEASNSTMYKFSRLTNIFMRANQERQVSFITQNLSNDFLCPNCHNSIPKTSSFCPDCGEKLEKCLICQTMLATDSIGTCPHCGRKFHVKHLKEALKVYGQCPSCKVSLKEYEIV